MAPQVGNTRAPAACVCCHRYGLCHQLTGARRITDDWVNIAAAIQAAKATRPAVGIYFPPGHYRVTKPLDMGAWSGMLVTGSIPGGAGIANELGVTRISADIAGPQVGACFDFSGSGYGRVSGIAFECSGGQVCALNARTAGIGPQDNFHPDWTIYGSDIVYERCNFHGGRVAQMSYHVPRTGLLQLDVPLAG